MDEDHPKRSLLDESLARSEVVSNTASRQQADRLVEAIVESALSGTLKYDRSVAASLRRAIEILDQKISRQLAAVLHRSEFQQLEAAWRGLQRLCWRSETGSTLQITVLPVAAHELQQDFAEHALDDTQAFRLLYQEAFERSDGVPRALLIADLDFDRAPASIALLRNLATVAATSFCPLIASAAPSLFGCDTFADFPGGRALQRNLEQKSAIPWNAYRQTDESRFVALTLPRVLARLPYGPGDTETPVDAFGFQEFPLSTGGADALPDLGHYCWMSSAWLLAERFVEAWTQTGPESTVPGVLRSMRVDGLLVHAIVDEWQDEHQIGPTEVELSHLQEEELGAQGFLPLCSIRGEDAATFPGVQTTQSAPKYAEAAAQQIAENFARLPCVTLVSYFARCVMLLISRCAHHVAVSPQESELDAAAYQKLMNAWLQQFVGETAAERVHFPLVEARVLVKDDRPAPGCYMAELSVRPWLAAAQLPAPITLEFAVPRIGG